MAGTDNALLNCLSFDVEEHFQVAAFESPMRRRHWDQYESRVERNVGAILNILSSHDIKATFFVLGWIAERRPSIIRTVAAAGHEIASHGYGHELITTQTPAAFREDVRRAKGILENIVGKPVLGYRAPSFTITKETQWALAILVEEGHAYDSSIFPILHDRYGFPGALPSCHQIATSAGSLWEVPPSTATMLGVRIPVAGGGYFRLFPYPLLRMFLRQILSSQRPLVMYLHPWELDPSQPRMKGPLLSRFRHYLNLDKTGERLKLLLQDFEFGTIQDALRAMESHYAVTQNGASRKTAYPSYTMTETKPLEHVG